MTATTSLQPTRCVPGGRPISVPDAAAHADDATAPADDGSSRSLESSLAAMPPVRKAAIVLVSLEQSLASQLLAHLDRSSVEAVTWEIARLERVDPAEQAAVLDEQYV